MTRDERFMELLGLLDQASVLEAELGFDTDPILMHHDMIRTVYINLED
jgi:hypothetical protein